MKELIEKLKELQKWDASTGEKPFIDWEEDNEHGEWVSKDDIEDLIKWAEAKRYNELYNRVMTDTIEMEEILKSQPADIQRLMHYKPNK